MRASQLTEQESTSPAAAEAEGKLINAIKESCKQGEEQGKSMGLNEKTGVEKVRRRSMGESGGATAHQHKLKHRMLMEVLQA